MDTEGLEVDVPTKTFNPVAGDPRGVSILRTSEGGQVYVPFTNDISYGHSARSTRLPV